MNSLLADRPWEDIDLKLKFSSMASLNSLYMEQEKVGGRSWEFNYMKCARESVLQGDMESTEEVLTHITEVYQPSLGWLPTR